MSLHRSIRPRVPARLLASIVAALATLGFGGGAGDASAQPLSLHEVHFDELANSGGELNQMSPPAGSQKTVCNLAWEASGTLRVLGTPAGGIGVQGGGSDFLIDNGEWVEFGFASGSRAESVRYVVSGTSNSDGDAIVGEHLVQAWGSIGTDLGTQGASGAGTHSLSALFGNQVITRFKISTTSDGVRIESVLFDTQPLIELWLGFSDRVWAEMDVCGIRIVGSDALETVIDKVTPSSWGALGVVGGSLGAGYMDPGDWIEFDLGGAVEGTYYKLGSSIDGDNDQIFFEHFLEAFGAGGTSLGVLALDGSHNGDGLDVNERFGNQLVTAFEITAIDFVQIRSVTSTVPAPTGSASALASLGALGWLLRRRNRPRAFPPRSEYGVPRRR